MSYCCVSTITGCGRIELAKSRLSSGESRVGSGAGLLEKEDTSKMDRGRFTLERGGGGGGKTAFEVGSGDDRYAFEGGKTAFEAGSGDERYKAAGEIRVAGEITEGGSSAAGR